MIGYRLRPDGSMGMFGTSQTLLGNGSDDAWTRAVNVVLRENNPVGVASGYYDEALTIVSLSEVFLSDLAYTADDFVRRTGASLAKIMVNTPLFPFTREDFRRRQGAGCFYMLTADGMPQLMYVVKKDITDKTGREQWVISIRCDAHSQSLALVNELFDNAYWSVDYATDGRVGRVQWSDQLRELLALGDEHAVPASKTLFQSLEHPEDRPVTDALFEKTLPGASAGEDFFDAEFRLSVGGRYEWFRTRAHVVRRHDGTVCRAVGILCNVNEEKLTDERELRHETFLRAFSDGNLCEFFVDLDADRYECHKRSEVVEELLTDNDGWSDFVLRFARALLRPDSRRSFLQLTERDYIRTALKADKGGLSGQFELLVGEKTVWVRLTVLPGDWNEDGTPRHVLVYLRDITLSKQREAERNALSREKAVFDQLLRGITRMVNRFAVCDLEAGVYQYYSLEHDMHYRPRGRYAELLSRIDEVLMPLNDERKGTMADFLATAALRREIRKETDVYRFDYCTKDKTGFMVMSVVPLAWHEGVLTKVMLVSEDSSQKHALEVLANTDGLTGLYNARNFALTLEKLSGTPFALFYLDLDGFKSVNDSYGHAVGDRLLQTVAKRLIACVSNEARVFRVGGDEFCLLVKGEMTTEDCTDIVARVKRAVAQLSVVGAGEMDVTTSCGFALSPEDSLLPDDVRELADRRMYEDKEATRRAQLKAAFAKDDAT